MFGLQERQNFGACHEIHSGGPHLNVGGSCVMELGEDEEASAILHTTSSCDGGPHNHLKVLTAV